MSIKIAVIEGSLNSKSIMSFSENVTPNNDAKITDLKNKTDFIDKLLIQNPDVATLKFEVRCDNEDFCMEDLITFIKRSIEEKVDIIVVNFNVKEFNKKLYQICEMAFKSNILIISSKFDESTKHYYPAEFPFVLEVNMFDNYGGSIENNSQSVIFAKEQFKNVENFATVVGCISKIFEHSMYSKREILKREFGVNLKIEKKTSNKKVYFSNDKKSAVMLLPIKENNNIEFDFINKNIVAYFSPKFNDFVDITDKNQISNKFDNILVINTRKVEANFDFDNFKKKYKKEVQLIGNFKNYENKECLSTTPICIDKNLFKIQTPILAVVSLGQNQSKFDVTLQLYKNFSQHKITPLCLSYNPLGIIYDFQYATYPHKIIFPDTVCDTNKSFHELETQINPDIFLIDIGGGICEINRNNRYHFGKLLDVYLDSISIDVVTMCVSYGYDINKLKNLFKKIYSYGVEKIFVVLSLNAYDIQTLEDPNGLHIYEIERKKYDTYYEYLKGNLDEEVFKIEDVSTEKLFNKILQTYN